MRILAADFETSGLDFNRHAPVSLGLALMEDGDIVDSANWTFAPPQRDGKISREYDICALKISGTTWKQIQEGTPIARAMQEVGVFVEKHQAASLPVVAFNAPFDLQWYSTCLFLGGSWNQQLRRFETFKPPLIGPWHCARLMAVTQLNLNRYDLDSVAAAFDMKREDTLHGAAEDAELAGRIYFALVKMAAQKVPA